MTMQKHQTLVRLCVTKLSGLILPKDILEPYGDYKEANQDSLSGPMCRRIFQQVLNHTLTI